MKTPHWARDELVCAVVPVPARGRVRLQTDPDLNARAIQELGDELAFDITVDDQQVRAVSSAVKSGLGSS